MIFYHFPYIFITFPSFFIIFHHFPYIFIIFLCIIVAGTIFARSAKSTGAARAKRAGDKREAREARRGGAQRAGGARSARPRPFFLGADSHCDPYEGSVRANVLARSKTNTSAILSLISCNEIYSATALGSASPGKKLVPKKIVHFRNLHNLGGPSGGPYMKISGFCSKFTFLRNLQFPPGVMLKKGGLPFSSTTHARGRANIFPLTDQSHHHYPPTKLRRRARSGEQSDNHLLIFFV